MTNPSDPGSEPLQERRRTAGDVRRDVALSLLVAALAFGLRYLDHRDFANEHFIFLSEAQAWLAGDWPIRDFTEPGMILTIGVSAASQALFGQTLLPELVLSIAAFAMAAAVTYWVTTLVSGRRALGVFAALIQIWIGPVLFAYPKLLIYPVLLALCLAYSRTPTRPRLALLAGWVAATFLIRHDQGLYASIAGVIVIASVHQADGLRVALGRAGSFLLACLLLLTPFVVYVQAVTGLTAYFTLGIEMSRLEAKRDPEPIPTFSVDRGPLFVVRPLREDELPLILIRWSPRTTDAARRALEERGQLHFGEAAQGRTWRYRVDRDALDALAGVLDEPAVEEVHGIGRATLRLPAEAPEQWIRRVTKLHRLELGPPIRSIVSTRNCVALLFYLCYILPVFALLLWLSPWSGRHRSRAVRAVSPALGVLALLCAAGLLRVNADRLPDVFGTFPILLCSVVSMLERVEGPRRRLAARATAALLVGTVAVAVYRIGSDKWDEALEVAFHPPTALARAVETTRSAREWPWAAQWPGDEEWKLAVYVHDCTRTDDRLLVTWPAPEFFYFSRRVFAGREGALLRLLRAPASYEHEVLDAWRRQRVPIVLTSSASDADFAAVFPRLAHHLAAAYTVADTIGWEGRSSITVHVDRSRVPVRRDPEFGLPCFTDRPGV